MTRSIEAHVQQITNRQGKKVMFVQTLEKDEEEYANGFAVGSILKRDRQGRFIGASIAIVLACDAAIELSKAIFPLVTTTLPINQWHPLLEQISNFSEQPIAVGALAAIAAMYMGKFAFSDRIRFRGIRRAYDDMDCGEGHYPKQPAPPPGTPNPPIP